MPDGSVVFSHVPAQGAAKVETITQDLPKAAPGPAPAKPAAPQVKTKPPVDPAVAKKLREEKVRQDRAAVKVAAAEKSLRAAETALKKGEQPLPGERIASADGKNRMTPAYWTRQRKLKDDVENARAELAKAQTQARAR
jgi:hypothetical protein